MTAPRSLLEDCCGWNKKLWADALAFALSSLPEDLAGKTVLEVGASEDSSVAPIFANRGANVICSHYGQTSDQVEHGQLDFVLRKYALGKIPVVELDINQLEGIYDIIVLKSVLGGLCRGDDYAKLRIIIDHLLEHVTEKGFIITLDNGYITLFDKLRRIRGAGRSDWTYFRREKLVPFLANYDARIQGFGFLNFGTATFLFKRDLEIVNDSMYFLDKVLVRIFRPKERAVLATVMAKRTG